MAFNNATTTAFWTNATQMNLDNDRRVRLQEQGLSTPADFLQFNEEMLEAAFENCKNKTDAIPLVLNPAQPDPAQPNHILQNFVPGIPAVPLTAIQTGKIKSAWKAAHYFTATNRSLTAPCMNFTNVLEGFVIEYNAVEKMSEIKPGPVPVISKNVPLLPWTELFENYCEKAFGVRTLPPVPLAAVIRKKAEVTPEAAANPGDPSDPLVAGKAYGKSGSVFQDLIHRTSHTHPLFKVDSQKVYALLVEATKGTEYAQTITAHSRSKDGRKAYENLLSSHAGADKWEKKAEDAQTWMMNATWSGRQYSIEKWCTKHQNHDVTMKEAKNHCPDVQLLSEATRVKYLINNIQNNDADLKAAIGLIRSDHNGAKNNFQKAVDLLLPVDPYNNKKRNREPTTTTATIGATTGQGHSAGTGSTGVEYRYYTTKAYNLLKKPQQRELRRWQKSKEGKAWLKSSKEAYKKQKTAVTDKSEFKKSVRAELAEIRAEEQQQEKETKETVAVLSQAIKEHDATAKETETNADVSSAEAQRSKMKLKISNISARLNGKKPGNK